MKPVDYKSVLLAVKQAKRALNTRGLRPGQLILILVAPDQEAVIGTTEDMTLDDVMALLRLSLRGGTIDHESEAARELAAFLRGLKLPEQFVVLTQDKHTGEHIFLAQGAPFIGAVGEAVFQTGRLIGQLDRKASQERQAAGVTGPSSGIQIKTKALSRWRRLIRLVGSVLT